MADYGVVRCQICFADFMTGDRLKQFPQCNDLFHIRCLELWTSFEACCPMCLLCFPGPDFYNQPPASAYSTRVAQQQTVSLAGPASSQNAYAASGYQAPQVVISNQLLGNSLADARVSNSQLQEPLLN